MTDNWLKIVSKLREMRLAKPGFADYTAFKRASGINRPTVEATENGDNRPSVDIIDKWVRACGSTLGAFFSDLEPAAGKIPKDAMKIMIKRANRTAHEKLEAILNDDEKGMREALEMNIQVFHNDFVRKPPKGK